MCAYYVYQKIQVNQNKKTSKKDIGRGEGLQNHPRVTSSLGLCPEQKVNSAIVKFFDELIDFEKQTVMKGLFTLNFEFGPLA